MTDGRRQSLLKDEELGIAMAELRNITGWLMLKSIANEKVEDLGDDMESSDDPNRVFSCVKQRNGILFLLNEVERLTNQGIKARATLLRYEA